MTNNAAGGPITLTGMSIGGANAADFAATGGNLRSVARRIVELHLRGDVHASTETTESGTLSIGVAEDPTSPRIGTEAANSASFLLRRISH